MAEVAIPRSLFADILRLIAELPAAAANIDGVRRSIVVRSLQSMGEVCLGDSYRDIFQGSAGRRHAPTPVENLRQGSGLPRTPSRGQNDTETGGYLENAGLTISRASVTPGKSELDRQADFQH